MLTHLKSYYNNFRHENKNYDNKRKTVTSHQLGNFIKHKFVNTFYILIINKYIFIQNAKEPIERKHSKTKRESDSCVLYGIWDVKSEA